MSTAAATLATSHSTSAAGRGAAFPPALLPSGQEAPALLLPSSCPPPALLLPSCLPALLPSCPPALLPSLLPSCLPALLPSCPPALLPSLLRSSSSANHPHSHTGLRRRSTATVARMLLSSPAVREAALACVGGPLLAHEERVALIPGSGGASAGLARADARAAEAKARWRSSPGLFRVLGRAVEPDPGQTSPGMVCGAGPPRSLLFIVARRVR